MDKVWCGFGEILGEWDGCNVLGVRGDVTCDDGKWAEIFECWCLSAVGTGF